MENRLQDFVRLAGVEHRSGQQAIGNGLKGVANFGAEAPDIDLIRKGQRERAKARFFAHRLALREQRRAEGKPDSLAERVEHLEKLVFVQSALLAELKAAL